MAYLYKPYASYEIFEVGRFDFCLHAFSKSKTFSWILYIIIKYNILLLHYYKINFNIL